MSGWGGEGMCQGNPDPIVLWGLEVCEQVLCQPWAGGLSPPQGRRNWDEEP